MFKPELYQEITIGELMTACKQTISPQDRMEDVMRIFEDTEQLILPIVENGIYKGFINKSTVFSAYRKSLKINTLE
jgi:CIC family chloride channel protein